MDRARARYLADSALSGHGVPAHRPSLEGLPRAFISCAEIDPCRDEAVEYAIRLFQAYVHTELHPPDDRSRSATTSLVRWRERRCRRGARRVPRHGTT
jgi:acetyl esterase/lipase